MIRKIVKIDERKCNGCGLCVPSCAEGAITIVDGKARLAADNLCDGLGACHGDCPQGAISIIEKDTDEFNEAAVEEHLKKTGRASGEQHHPVATAARPTLVPHHGGCPGSRVMTIAPTAADPAATLAEPGGTSPNHLRQWPVQLHLVPTTAPYFQNADLLIAADCVPFAYGNFHKDFLAGKALVIGCPKLDDNRFYQEKLTELFRVSSIKSVTVLRMEVPCCGGIVGVAAQAVAASGKDIPFSSVVIGIDGTRK
jgi:NAD-dependent dihydropyrimidine dehydrogenase PreA subunit